MRLIILLLLSFPASAQFIIRGDTLMYVNRTGDTILLNKTRNASNNIYSQGTGTAYTLTATPAKIEFGTTSPGITFNDNGTYEVTYNILANYSGATLALSRNIVYKVRRTNRSPADISSSVFTIQTPIITASTFSAPTATMTFQYTATKGDVLELWGSISVLPTLGSVIVSVANLQMNKLY